MKKYRFFYHFNKVTRKMTLHYRKKCISVDNIHCYPYCETKRSKTQPYLVMQGFAGEILVVNGTATIYP